MSEPIELCDAIQHWLNRLPPPHDDPQYLTRYNHLKQRLHPAIAAVLANDEHFGLNHRYRQDAA